MEDIRIKRLEVLKDELIKRNLSEMDLDNIYDSYDLMLYKVFADDEFDNVFLSKNLENVEEDERHRIMDLARKYNSLCFYHGNFDNWLDSVEGVTGEDYSLIAIKLLDSFDYLIRLAKNGGEDVLKFLNKFQSSEQFKNGAVMSILRPGNKDDSEFDDVLETILIEMAKTDGTYKDFSDTQKIIMCDNLDGIIYKEQDNRYGIVPVIELKKSILEEFGEDDYPIKGIDSETFRMIIESIYCGYQTRILKRQ